MSTCIKESDRCSLNRKREQLRGNKSKEGIHLTLFKTPGRMARQRGKEQKVKIKSEENLTWLVNSPKSRSISNGNRAVEYK